MWGNLPVFMRSFCKSASSGSQCVLPFGIPFSQEERFPQDGDLIFTLFVLGISDIVSSRVSIFPLSYICLRLNVAKPLFQRALDRFTQWKDFHKFRLSATKTFAIYFSWGSFQDLDLRLHGWRFPLVGQTRFFGIIFDSHLTWIRHLKRPKSRQY